MSTSETDADLAECFRRGEARAFEELVVRHLDALRRFLAVLSPGDPGVDDLEQEVLVRVHGALGRWRGEGAFTTWLFTLARRTVIDELRRRQRERTRVDLWGRRSRPEEEILEQAADPQSAWVTTEEGRALRRALGSLPEPDRSLLYLKDAEDQSVAELARIWGLKEGTVKSKLSRARARLKELLEEERYA